VGAGVGVGAGAGVAEPPPPPKALSVAVISIMPVARRTESRLPRVLYWLLAGLDIARCTL